VKCYETILAGFPALTITLFHLPGLSVKESISQWLCFIYSALEKTKSLRQQDCLGFAPNSLLLHTVCTPIIDNNIQFHAYSTTFIELVNRIITTLARGAKRLAFSVERLETDQYKKYRLASG